MGHLDMIEYINADGSSSGDVESLSGEDRSSVDDGIFVYYEISGIDGLDAGDRSSSKEDRLSGDNDQSSEDDNHGW